MNPIVDVVLEPKPLVWNPTRGFLLPHLEDGTEAGGLQGKQLHQKTPCHLVSHQIGSR